MFDTIRLETPLVCPGCGREETTVQTHHFGETLDTYRIGMIVPQLRSDLERWHEYQGQQKEPPSDREPASNAMSRLSSFFLPDEAIRNAADPLAAILGRHPPEGTGDAGVRGLVVHAEETGCPGFGRSGV